MRLIVLGAAAGGGLPQWNCGCSNCQAARQGRLASMSQSSVAVSADGRTWAVLNASPDIRSQLAATPALAPTGLRGSPIGAVIVTNGDVDHVAGLIGLREGTAFDLWGTPEMLSVLDANPVFRVANPDIVPRCHLPLEAEVEPLPGLFVTAVAVPGKAPLWREAEEGAGAKTGAQTVGLRIAAGGRVVWYVPGCADLPEDLVARLEEADVLLFDGTVWADDDMIRSGTGTKTGRRMGHLQMSGQDGSIARLSSLSRTRRVFIHVNNTNPVLDPESPERAAMTAAGWELAFDRQEIVP